ncbi:MAG: hypothetical protein ACHQK8_06580, partial [Bacteroidia bacterium]
MNQDLMKPIAVFCCLFISFSVLAQPVFDPVGADAWGTGGCSAASRNIFAVFNNPAAFSGEKKLSGGIYSEQLFHETKLTRSCLAMVFPMRFIHSAISIDHYGYSLFSQQKLGFSLSKKLVNNFSLGVTLGYFNTNISEQNPAGNFYGEFGVWYKPIRKIQFGLYVFNPTQNKYSSLSYDKMPTIARIGTTYEVSDKVDLLLETEQTLNQQLFFRGGIKYRMNEIFSVSIGAANVPVIYT